MADEQKEFNVCLSFNIKADNKDAIVEQARILAKHLAAELKQDVEITLVVNEFVNDQT